ncbi:UNVERIFIED_CONTAM: hypothetical protein GTU68_023245 [Idotea baltica]|nr:hypothetical protein [Idotea baltica]
MLLFFLKALHIIGFVTWFAGLFYLVRMFVYHVEAESDVEPKRTILIDQFKLMQRRVYYIICMPAVIITWSAGTAMLFANTAYLSQGWIQVKLLLVVLLTIYHHSCKSIMNKLAAGTMSWTSTQFRQFNEVPTLFLVAIVLLAVYRTSLNALYAFIGLVLFGVLLQIGIKSYKKYRDR